MTCRLLHATESSGNRNHTMERIRIAKDGPLNRKVVFRSIAKTIQ